MADRMCSLAVECVFVLWKVFSYYSMGFGAGVEACKVLLNACAWGIPREHIL